MAGVLYLVGTPVGNLGDISHRAVDVLRSADIIVAEDTRRSKTLLDRYGVTGVKIESYHSHNLDRKTPVLIRRMLGGASVALVTDAGSPGISDPGAVLVKAAVEAGVCVCPVPGPAAPILAVTASGFPSHRFVFEGFLPRKKGRKTLIESWKDEPRTIVFFEAPNRLVKTLEKIRDIVGIRKICVARELTKKFEEFIRGDIGDVIEELKSRKDVKGEITVVVAPEKF